MNTPSGQPNARHSERPFFITTTVSKYLCQRHLHRLHVQTSYVDVSENALYYFYTGHVTLDLNPTPQSRVSDSTTSLTVLCQDNATLSTSHFNNRIFTVLCFQAARGNWV